MKKSYLEKNVFYGLKNQNTGFDVETIKYFSEKDFEVVLDRVEKLGIGIIGIEPWKNGVMYDVLTCEEFSSNPKDSNWYRKAFNFFRRQEKELLYSATYQVHKRLLDE